MPSLCGRFFDGGRGGQNAADMRGLQLLQRQRHRSRRGRAVARGPRPICDGRSRQLDQRAGGENHAPLDRRCAARGCCPAKRSAAGLPPAPARQTRNRLAVLAGEKTQQVFGQGQDVAGPLAQRRHRHFDHIQAIDRDLRETRPAAISASRS